MVVALRILHEAYLWRTVAEHQAPTEHSMATLMTGMAVATSRLATDTSAGSRAAAAPAAPAAAVAAAGVADMATARTVGRVVRACLACVRATSGIFSGRVPLPMGAALHGGT